MSGRERSDEQDSGIQTRNEQTVNPFPTCRPFLMMPLSRRLFENIVTKEEIALKRAISPFVTMFSTFFSNHALIYKDFPCYVGKG